MAESNQKESRSYIPTVISCAVTLFVGITVLKSIPAEVWPEAWEMFKTFANTWPGILVIAMMAVPIITLILYLTIKLIMFMTGTKLKED